MIDASIVRSTQVKRAEELYKQICAKIEQAMISAAMDSHNELHECYDDGYSGGYSLGHSGGYSKGHSDGYALAYEDGRSAGYSAGYSRGYSEGHSEVKTLLRMR